jgi:hypothetical protein
MISLPIEELPLLIKEKVKFYYDRQLWLNNIKIMHQQYEEKVVIIDYIPFDLILWRNKDPYNRMEYGIPICKTGGATHRCGYNIIREFRNKRCVGSPIVPVPPKYHYTSGLNNSNAYK